MEKIETLVVMILGILAVVIVVNVFGEFRTAVGDRIRSAFVVFEKR